MHIESWSKTDVGQKREINEDSHLCSDALQLYIVADGMGGHQAGDLASRTAVEVIEADVRRHLPDLKDRNGGHEGGTQVMAVTEHPVASMLAGAVQAASAAILTKVEENYRLNGMGTTTSLLFFYEDRLFLAHVGDSRIYRFRDGRIAQLTKDHSLVQEQVEAGLLTRREADTSQLKNIITRSVGFDPKVPVDTMPVDAKPDDIFLLCSDGLSNLVSSREFVQILDQKDPPTALNFFVNLANSRGGDDNITAILLRLSE